MHRGSLLYVYTCCARDPISHSCYYTHYIRTLMFFSSLSLERYTHLFGSAFSFFFFIFLLYFAPFNFIRGSCTVNLYFAKRRNEQKIKNIRRRNDRARTYCEAQFSRANKTYYRRIKRRTFIRAMRRQKISFFFLFRALGK